MTVSLSKVEMPYIGYVLSVNHCCYRGGYGGRLRKEVADWMRELAEKVEWIPPTFREKPVTIGLRGVFRDRRSTPDLANLHKVVGDAIARGLRMDDVDFRFEDKGYRLDKTARPCLEMTITMGEKP